MCKKCPCHVSCLYKVIQTRRNYTDFHCCRGSCWLLGMVVLQSDEVIWAARGGRLVGNVGEMITIREDIWEDPSFKNSLNTFSVKLRFNENPPIDIQISTFEFFIENEIQTFGRLNYSYLHTLNEKKKKSPWGAAFGPPVLVSARLPPKIRKKLPFTET